MIRKSTLDEASSTRFHIPSLDGIRAAAFVVVFAAHSGMGHLIPGGFGVTVFFFLSGYLITTLLRVEYEKVGFISLRNFYMRRIFRIFPPMYITLLAGMSLVFVGMLNDKMSIQAVLMQMLHLTNYQMIFFGKEGMIPETSIYWSLAIEEHFYLFFPLALVLILRSNTYVGVTKRLLALCAIVLVWRCSLVFGFGYEHLYIYHATDTRADLLLYGCILGLWGNPYLDKNSVLEFNGHMGKKVVVVSIAVGLLLLCFLYRNEQFRDTFRYSIQGIALFPLFYYAVRYPQWIIFRWLEIRAVRWIGMLSYTLYLSHMLSLALAGKILGSYEPTFERAAVGLAIALLYSAIMFRFIERPFAALRRRLHRD